MKSNRILVTVSAYLLAMTLAIVFYACRKEKIPDVAAYPYSFMSDGNWWIYSLVLPPDDSVACWDGPGPYNQDTIRQWLKDTVFSYGCAKVEHTDTGPGYWTRGCDSNVLNNHILNTKVWQECNRISPVGTGYGLGDYGWPLFNNYSGILYGSRCPGLLGPSFYDTLIPYPHPTGLEWDLRSCSNLHTSFIAKFRISNGDTVVTVPAGTFRVFVMEDVKNKTRFYFNEKVGLIMQESFEGKAKDVLQMYHVQ